MATRPTTALWSHEDSNELVGVAEPAACLAWARAGLFFLRLTAARLSIEKDRGLMAPVLPLRDAL